MLGEMSSECVCADQSIMIQQPIQLGSIEYLLLEFLPRCGIFTC